MAKQKAVKAKTAVKSATGKQKQANKNSDGGKPVRCIHRHTEKELRQHFRRVCDGLIDKAAEGGVGQMRMLLQIGRFEEKKSKGRRGGKGLSALLLDELKRRQDEREAAMDSQTSGCAAAGEGKADGEGAASGEDAEEQ